jgi:hypothetical protein
LVRVAEPEEERDAVGVAVPEEELDAVQEKATTFASITTAALSLSAR